MLEFGSGVQCHHKLRGTNHQPGLSEYAITFSAELQLRHIERLLIRLRSLDLSIHLDLEEK